MKVCYSHQMREIDKQASDIGGIPSVVLMENAARACVDEIIKLNGLKSASIFCGKGNNGGDGFAIARMLYNRGINVTVYLVCGSEFSQDALINYEIISKYPIKIKELNDTDYLDLYIRNEDIIVDAIFGTGIDKEVSGLCYDVIDVINNNSKYTLSVDVPSGINADTGEILNICIKADKTVTFAAYKTGLLLFPAVDYTGEIVCADISIPDYIINSQDITINTIDKALAKKLMPKRKTNSHKGDYGKILIVAGSRGLTGAAAMAANAALKSGAGLISVATPYEVNDILEVKLTEPMTIPLASVDGHLGYECTRRLCEIINDFDVCLFGPGLGRSEDITNILKELLKASKIPIIIDADGLYALSQIPTAIEECSCNLILTPHEMEFSRLTNYSVNYISKNRLEVSKDYATKNCITLILKGPHTIVTLQSGEQYININGNNGMACGGSGDVLAGILATMCARIDDEAEACILSVYLHADAGDVAASTTGYNSLTPTDIIENISKGIININ